MRLRAGYCIPDRVPLTDGDHELLVYGECSCAGDEHGRKFRMAAPEGAQWPKCPHCDEQVLPPSPPERPEGETGPWHGDRHAFVAEFMPEGDAIARIREMGWDFNDPYWEAPGVAEFLKAEADKGRQYVESQTEGKYTLDDRGNFVPKNAA